jgi:uncharacterized protein YcgL (UPF0745 family)
MQKQLVDIYRSGKKEGLYLYVKSGLALDALPEALLKQFGKAEKSMTILITPDKKLALAEAEDVLHKLEEQDFYLQMPPSIVGDEA